MLYSIFGISLSLFALAVILISLKVLVGKRWFMAWLRGTLALASILFSLALLASAWDFVSYRVANQNETVATVAVKEIASQQYQLELVLPEGGATKYTVSGDLWQLDARLITWSGPIAMLGLKPGYRLDRLSGRYLTLEQERQAERTIYNVDNSMSVVDVWAVINNNAWIPWVDTRYGSATYLPMKDGALYSVNLNQQGLIARPLNESAERAIATW